MTPRNDEQNQLIRDERREQILKAALTIFARKGIAAAKISDIASLAGLSHGLVYHYFRSKDEIFTELVKAAIGGAEMSFQAALTTPLPPLEKLQLLTETILTQAYEGEGPYYFFVMILAYTLEAIPEEAKACFDTYEATHIQLLVSVLLEGQKMGQIVDGDPIQLATLYISIIHGLAVLQIQDSIPLPLPTTEMVMRMFRKATT